MNYYRTSCPSQNIVNIIDQSIIEGLKFNSIPILKKKEKMFVKNSSNFYIRSIENIIQQDGYTIIIFNVLNETNKCIVKTYKKDIFDRELGLMMCLAKTMDISRIFYRNRPTSYNELKKCFVNGRHSKKNLEINKALVKGYILSRIPLKEYNKLWDAFKEKYND